MERQFPCTVAGTTLLSSAKSLRTHLNSMHSGPVKCEDCGITLPNKSAVYRHMNGDCEAVVEKKETPGERHGHSSGHKTRSSVMGYVILGHKSISDAVKRIKLPSSIIGDSRVLQQIGGIFDFPEENVWSYDYFIALIDPIKRIPTTVVEIIEYADMHGPGPTYTPTSGTLMFTPDPRIAKAIQATAADYGVRDEETNPSKFHQGHCVNYAHHCKSESDFAYTFVTSNRAPMSSKLNKGAVRLMDNCVSSTVRDHQAAIVITTLLPASSEDDEIWLGKKGDKRVYVPKSVGKTIIYRNDGLHIVGFKCDQTYEEFDLEEGMTDPFVLSQEAGLPLQVNRSSFKSVNTKNNTAADYQDVKDILPIKTTSATASTTLPNSAEWEKKVETLEREKMELQMQLSQTLSSLRISEKVQAVQKTTISLLQNRCAVAEFTRDIAEGKKQLLSLGEVAEECKKRRRR